MTGTLYVVATPIGNLGDLTFRAVEVLKSVAIVAAEDTRRTRQLLTHYDVPRVELLALHEHNEEAQLGVLLDRLASDDVALVSDAGTPLMADPGFRLVRAARAQGIRVSPVPGVSAMSAVISVCPLPLDDVMFAGFLPSKGAARTRRIEALAARSGAVVLFESTHRILSALQEFARVCAERRIFVGREMTKLHEEFLLGNADELLETLTVEHRGEFVVVLGAVEQVTQTDGDALLRELIPLLPPRRVAQLVSKFCGGDTREWYRKAVAEKHTEQ